MVIVWWLVESKAPELVGLDPMGVKDSELSNPL